MKLYPKKYEDLFRDKESLKVSRIQAYEGYEGDTIDLVKQFDQFFNDSFREMFRIALRYLWLEKQISYNGERRVRRWQGGHIPDQIFGRFMSDVVGYNQSLLTRARWFHVSHYFVSDYYPDFLLRNPFKDPDYFEYPYEHATLDFYGYCYQVHNRKELMEYAEERQMSYHEFRNWVNNYVLCYNEEQGEEIYAISKGRDSVLYISSTQWTPQTQDILYEPPEKEA